MELKFGCRASVECAGCCSHLQQPCPAFQVPTHCRRKSWCELNHKLATDQLPMIEQSLAGKHTEIAYLLCWRVRREFGSVLPKAGVQPLWRMLTSFGVSFILKIGKGRGEHSAYSYASSGWQKEDKNKRTIRAGPNDGLCRPGCKVIEWDPCGNGDKENLFKGRPIKSKHRSHGPCCHPSLSRSGSSKIDRHCPFEKVTYR